MRTLHALLVLSASVVLVGCGGSSTTGTSREFHDAGVSAGGSRGTSKPDGGSSNVQDAGSDAGLSAEAAICNRGAVSNVVMSHDPQSAAPRGAGGTSAVGGTDAGHLHGLPTDPCVTYRAPDCPGDPRAIFGCPTVSGPNGGATVHAGDMIAVTVPIADDGLGAYSCEGLSGDLVGGTALVYGVSPGYVERSGQVPPSTKPGAVIHFTAEASGTAYSSTPGAACSNDLTRMSFDVTVE